MNIQFDLTSLGTRKAIPLAKNSNEASENPNHKLNAKVLRSTINNFIIQTSIYKSYIKWVYYICFLKQLGEDVRLGSAVMLALLLYNKPAIHTSLKWVFFFPICDQ